MLRLALSSSRRPVVGAPLLLHTLFEYLFRAVVEKKSAENRSISRTRETAAVFRFTRTCVCYLYVQKPRVFCLQLLPAHMLPTFFSLIFSVLEQREYFSLSNQHSLFFHTDLQVEEFVETINCTILKKYTVKNKIFHIILYFQCIFFNSTESQKICFNL